MTAGQITQILRILADAYPDAHCELNFNSPFQLLIAVILSAQCTDKRVNIVTERLFAKYAMPEDFVQLSQAELEAEIKECGLFHTKAKHILATCSELLQKFHGQVPADLALLVGLPGVGRKTANVVASNAFGIPAIGVDTHVLRVANRIGLANSQKVEQVEMQLMQVIPQEQWINSHHRLVWHGRRVCEARHPKCAICPLQQNCRYFAALGA
ncbi:MAG: endonuclease III [Peptococcaceae bacterium]|nr:endonuclease III [Peptococcaceae bacterium]